MYSDSAEPFDRQREVAINRSNREKWEEECTRISTRKPNVTGTWLLHRNGYRALQLFWVSASLSHLLCATCESQGARCPSTSARSSRTELRTVLRMTEIQMDSRNTTRISATTKKGKRGGAMHIVKSVGVLSVGKSISGLPHGCMGRTSDNFLNCGIGRATYGWLKGLSVWRSAGNRLGSRHADLLWRHGVCHGCY